MHWWSETVAIPLWQLLLAGELVVILVGLVLLLVLMDQEDEQWDWRDRLAATVFVPTWPVCLALLLFWNMVSFMYDLFNMEWHQ